jgi:hypothetical protein
MPEFFGYAKRSDESQIDWSVIGKDMTKFLQDEAKTRETKKAEIEKNTRDLSNTLANPPQGQYKELNSWALDAANTAQQSRLLQDRLLRTGRMSLKDYTIARQSLTDGMKGVFDLTTEYNQEYDAKMERMRKNESQNLEGYFMEQLEGFANFTQSKVLVDPVTNNVSLGMFKPDEKGNIVFDRNPDSYATVAELRNRVKSKFDRFKSSENVASYVGSLGKQITAVKTIGTQAKTGSIRETLDIKNRKNFSEWDKKVIKEFEDAETLSLESMLASNQYNISSILTNDIKSSTLSGGKQYTFTFDEDKAKADKSLILLKMDQKSGLPVPQYTKDQEKEALEYLRVQARLQYDYTESAQAVTEPKRETYRPSAGDEADSKRINEGINLLTSHNKLRWGTRAEKNIAARELTSGIPNLVDVYTTTNNSIMYKRVVGPNNDIVEYELPLFNPDGTPVSPEEWARMGQEVTGLRPDEATKYDKSGLTRPSKLDAANFGGVRSSRTVRQQQQQSAPM